MRGLLYRSLRPLTGCRSGQEHIWFRIPGNNYAVSSARVSEKPFDLLIRVPASTLSTNTAQDNSKDITSSNIQQCEFSRRTLQNVKFLLVPRRNFGLGRKDPAFGHARFHGRINWVEPAVFGAFFICIISLFIDWRKLKEEYGINILPDVLYRGMTQGIDSEGQEILHSAKPAVQDAPSSEALMLTEKRDKIHAMMKRESEKRMLFKVAAHDPEIAALVEGRQVQNPVDVEMFLLKKKYVEDLNFTPEELSQPLFDQIDSEQPNENDASLLDKIGRKMNGLLSLKAEEDIKELESDVEDDKKHEKRLGFKDRKIIEYENRIRSYSTPDKIFRYFATYRMADDKGHQEVMMSPQDFLRSITPDIQQPANKGLDQFTNITKNNINLLAKDFGVEESSIFNQLGSSGLITFSDYLFLLTVLSTSRRHFEIAFKMFDLNGDGNVDAREFENVTNLMRSQSSMGARHRDHGNTGSTLKGMNSGLITYFFGQNRKENLTVDDFLAFQRKLQNEILRLEFDRKRESSSEKTSSPDGEPSISEKDFGDLLIAYAGFPAKKKARMLKRVKSNLRNENMEGSGSAKNKQVSKKFGLTLSEFLNFFKMLNEIDDIDEALTFYRIAGVSIDKMTLKHVANKIAHVKLTDNITNVIFVLFDESGDGKLSHQEFLAVMKHRRMRGLDQRKDTGFCRIFSTLTKCASIHSQSTLCNG